MSLLLRGTVPLAVDPEYSLTNALVGDIVRAIQEVPHVEHRGAYTGGLSSQKLNSISSLFLRFFWSKSRWTALLCSRTVLAGKAGDMGRETYPS